FISVHRKNEYAYLPLLADEAYIPAQKAGDKIMLGWVEYLRGMLYTLRDRDLKQAKIHFESCLSFFREARFWDVTNLVMTIVAAVEHRLGDNNLAQRHFEEALNMQGEIQDTMEDSFIGLASIARARGEFLRSAHLLGAAQNHIVAHYAKLFPEIFTYE